ncbi:MAG: alpha/beta hydrolase [Lachnospiraceae bacterium]|nr:alpha/beta hydrolase [Lachnospiraceae bacterium]
MIIVTKIQIPGMQTQKPRRLYVSLPKGYEGSDKRYPVLYMFDGHNVFYDSHATYGKSWGMREYLKKSGRELIVVGIECNHEGSKRLSEYAPFDFSAGRLGRINGLGEKTMEWMTKQLKPEIDAKYRTLPGREHTMIAGSSMGGLMAVYAAVAYNDVFSRAAALSPCLYFGTKEMNELIKEKTLIKPSRIYMDYGSGETGERPGPWKLMFRTALRLSDKGAHVSAAVIPGDLHSEAYWEKRIPAFMDFLWAREGL